MIYVCRYTLLEVNPSTLYRLQGKQARQKYDEQAHKAVVTALQQVGYTEDRTASGVMECAGMYKLQHDTGKNLKTVVVYPRIASANKKSSAKDNDNNEEGEALIPEHTPGYKLAVASMPTFQSIIKSKCPSWSQKKGCLECLDALTDIIHSLDEKLMHGQPLSETEQSFYNAVSHLEEKKEYMKHESKEQVEQGQITALEKELLLEHNAQRLEEAPNNTKLLERQKLLKSIDPIEPVKLKHHADIAKLQKEVAKLMHLNENQLLSVKERQMVTRREQIWNEITELQDASRGWFEEDDVFEARVQASQQGLEKFRSSNNKANSTSTKTTSTAAHSKIKATAKGSAGNKWILPSQQAGGKKKKESRSSGPGVFDTMRLRQGDDSGSGSSTDGEDEEETVPTTTRSTPPSQKISSKGITNDGNQSKSKKSKKKKKKKDTNKASNVESDDFFLESTSRQVANAKEEKAHDVTAFGQFWGFLQAYVFPLFLVLFSWLANVIFGKSKKKAKKS